MSQQEEVKADYPQPAQAEGDLSLGIEERELCPLMKGQFQKLVQRLSPRKLDANTFGSSMRLFSVSADQRLGFPSNHSLRAQYSRGFAAIYIFRMHQVRDGYTHGIYLRLNGFVHRQVFAEVLDAMVISFVGQRVPLKSVVPLVKKNVSLCEYLLTLYVSHSNLLVNFSHQSDVLAESQRMHRPNNLAADKLKKKMQSLTCQIIDNMLAMPSRYPCSYLSTTLSQTVDEFRRHMRSTNLAEVTLRIGQDAYNQALQDTNKLKQSEIQELMDPLTKRAMLNRCVTPRITKAIQLLFQQTFGTSFVHPHPFNHLFKSQLPQLKPLDGIIFDPRFLFILLLVSRWFTRSCMLEETMTSNNQAHLLLYGGAGTGKSLITAVIASSVPTYKFITGSQFQNPEMLSSSLLSIDEFNTASLPSNEYKQLLDLKTHVKLDFKNMHPENVTESMPCILNTNDEIFTVLKLQKKHAKPSVDAALRRLYIVPVKSGVFERLHGRTPVDHRLRELLEPFNTRFDTEQSKLPRMFNLIMAFALFQTDLRGFYLDNRLHGYFEKLVNDFVHTAFGTFYLSKKATIDELIKEVEEAMIEEDSDDTSYLVKVSSCAGQFQQLVQEYFSSVAIFVEAIDPVLVKDKTVPWPVRAYYAMSFPSFHASVMRYFDEGHKLLNQEVARFLGDPQAQLFVPALPGDSDIPTPSQRVMSDEEFAELESLIEKASSESCVGGNGPMLQNMAALFPASEQEDYSDQDYEQSVYHKKRRRLE